MHEDLEMLMNVFRKLEPEARSDLFLELKYNDEFCLECGYPNGGKQCHCQNDE